MDPPAPRILITWSRSATRPPDRYLEAVRTAGGQPILLPAPAGPAALAEAGGLLLAGGRDVDPPLYGQAPDERVAETLEIDRERDETELALIAAALARELPVLGICRGIQVLNVALGGSLVQDLSLVGLDPAAHQQRRRQPEPPEWTPAHDVEVEPGSRLAGFLGARAAVNSFHHQAVDRPAPALRVTARSPDGIIEGLEAADDRFIVGVQWHPERMVEHTPPQRALFAAFVAAARARSGAPA